ncbi:MAG: hypothetical protein KME23_17125 [Goleter apudmare HA4340-LM2]|jgi:hypothetical protein|nr:hypothetical protein [Goleter apudmare HA4340-LM2]
MQNSAVREHLVAGIAFCCGVVATSVISVSLPQAVAQRTSRETLVAQSIVNEENALKFESRGCQRTKPTQVSCDVLITNIGKERQTLRFAVSPNYDPVRTNAIDASGTVYTAQTIQSGAGLTGGSKGGEYFNISLAVGIPTKVTSTFEIPQEITNLAALDVGYLNNGGSYTRTAIPNIGTITSNSASTKNPCPASSTRTR